MRYLFLICLLFVGCRTRDKITEATSAPLIIDNTVNKLVDIIHSIGSATDRIKAEAILIDRQSSGIASIERRDIIKRSINNISHSNDTIKGQNEILYTKINPQLEQAKKATEETEEVNKDLQRFIDGPAYKFIRILLGLCIFSLPISFFIGIKFPPMRDEMQAIALVSGVTILACICITWLFDHKIYVVIFSAFSLGIVLLRFLFKRHKSIKKLNNDSKEIS